LATGVSEVAVGSVAVFPVCPSLSHVRLQWLMACWCRCELRRFFGAAEGRSFRSAVVPVPPSGCACAWFFRGRSASGVRVRAVSRFWFHRGGSTLVAPVLAGSIRASEPCFVFAFGRGVLDSGCSSCRGTVLRASLEHVVFFCFLPLVCWGRWSWNRLLLFVVGFLCLVFRFRQLGFWSSVVGFGGFSDLSAVVVFSPGLVLLGR